MKKLIKKIMLSAAAFAVAFGFTFVPVKAGAEEIAETPEISAEMPEISTETGGVEEVPETSEETSENPEEMPETGDNSADITLEDLLGAVGDIAEKEGLGDEWEVALENIKLAISEKKLDVNIVLDALLLVVLTAYAIYKVIGGIVKNIATKKATATVLSEVQTVGKSSLEQTKAVNAQTEAINTLAETDGQVVEKVDKENDKLNALAAAQVGTNAAIRCLIRGIGMSGTVKDEAYRALNNSDENCDKAQK